MGQKICISLSTDRRLRFTPPKLRNTTVFKCFEKMTLGCVWVERSGIHFQHSGGADLRNINGKKTILDKNNLRHVFPGVLRDSKVSLRGLRELWNVSSTRIQSTSTGNSARSATSKK